MVCFHQFDNLPIFLFDNVFCLPPVFNAFDNDKFFLFKKNCDYFHLHVKLLKCCFVKEKYVFSIYRCYIQQLSPESSKLETFKKIYEVLIELFDCISDSISTST